MIHTLAFGTAEAIALLLFVITIVISPIKTKPSYFQADVLGGRAVRSNQSILTSRSHMSVRPHTIPLPAQIHIRQPSHRTFSFSECLSDIWIESQGSLAVLPTLFCGRLRTLIRLFDLSLKKKSVQVRRSGLSMAEFCLVRAAGPIYHGFSYQCRCCRTRALLFHEKLMHVF